MRGGRDAAPPHTIILPQPGACRAGVATSRGFALKKYMCLICGFIYDEAAGLPDEGIAAGTKWEDVPPNWTCPECGARKDDFEMVEF